MLLKRLSIISTYKRTFGFSVLCILLSFTLIVLSRTIEGFAQWYAANVYPIIPSTIGRAFSIWDFSVFEASVLLFLILTGSFALSGLRMIFRHRLKNRSQQSKYFRCYICFTAAMFVVFTLNSGINYSRDNIGSVLKLPIQEATEENLVKLSMILAEELTALTEDPKWDYSVLTAESTAYIETEAVNAMKLLGEREPSLSGYYPEPKPVYLSKSLSSLGIEGIFSPFTMEANYNNDMTSFLIPYTICHELAHLKGYMKEEDAGFIAYLACRNSSSMVLQYSGLFHALTYALNALYVEAPYAEYKEIYFALPEPIRAQLNYVKEQRMENASMFTTTSKSVNNLYLKANAQAGTKSYTRIVDLLISDYADRIHGGDLL